MKGKKVRIRLAAAVFCLFTLMLNADTAAQGAQEGLALCIQTIIPSLFPFFLITTYLNPMLWTVSPRFIRNLCDHLMIPKGCEGVLMLGLVGGYPVGAQSVSEAYRQGQISKQQAQILMGYCNNAGPAFIFGVAGQLFDSPAAAWILWFIHIISALLTGSVLPKVYSGDIDTANNEPIILTQAFHKSIWITASVCGWIVVFKVIITMIIANFPSALEPYLAYLGGLLELSGGCLSLFGITNHSLRFILCSAFLSFGGICVLMQTASVSSNLGLGLYLPGKIIQTGFSILISLLLILWRNRNFLPASALLIIAIVSTAIIYILAYFCRKRYGNNLCYDV